MYRRDPCAPQSGPLAPCMSIPNLVASTTSLRLGAEGLAQVLLGEALAVDVGGVEQRDAGVERGVDDRQGLVCVDATAEVVAPEADDRDGQTGVAEPPPALSSRACGNRWLCQAADGIAPVRPATSDRNPELQGLRPLGFAACC